MKDQAVPPTDETEAVAAFMVERDLFARQMGIRLVELRPGYSQAEMTLTPTMVNGLGLPHGGAIFTLADFAFAVACNSYGEAAVALSMDIHFLASPQPASRLKAEAMEIRRGGRTSLYRMTVTDEHDQLLADLHGMAYLKRTRFVEVTSHEAEG